MPGPHAPIPVDGAIADIRQRVVLLATTRPAAVAIDRITKEPSNVTIGETPVLIFRDAAMGQVKAFDRRIEADLMPKFESNHDAKRKGVAFVDADTHAGWNLAGIAVDGDKAMR